MDPQKLNLDANVKYGVNLKAKNTKDQVQVSVASTFRKRGVDTMTNYTAKLEMPSQVHCCGRFCCTAHFVKHCLWLGI
ncbi:hypothetical protein DPMN_105038 [Dreissena polymorpha]|uniref:Uncharacterized protein n=1 Tax=Dreissena polymorpha TaxID=45954 RepID=A0A9D4K369_DREPO|nr:hypothetical protein DPMN_105038 [Dreissena polymorpha]